MRFQITRLVLSALFASSVLAYNYELEFSTYLGGSDWEHARDIKADKQGNIYVVGGTNSDDFPVTPGAYQQIQDKTGVAVGSAGYSDAFVAKYDPFGALIWCTLLGGENYDRAYGVEVDDEGYVYVSGRAGPGFPTTPGAMQENFGGYDSGNYGDQNGFVCKLEPDGSDLVWSTFVGTGQPCRDLAIDADGDVYVPIQYPGFGPKPPAVWFANAFQATTQGGIDVGALKLSADGSTVLWATWVSGSANEQGNCGIHVDSQKNVILNFRTLSTDMPTVNAHDASYNGGGDAFFAKLNPEGSGLIFATYFGGSANETGNSTHNLAIDAEDNIYYCCFTMSTDIATTPNAFQSSYAGGSTDMIAAKFSPTGQLLLCTYIGGSADDGTEGIAVSPDGQLFVAGNTDSSDFPVTASSAFQAAKAGSTDAFFLLLAEDFESLVYSTYLGGDAHDDGRCGFIDAYGNLYMAGSTSADDGWPTLNAEQPDFAGGTGDCLQGACDAGECIIAKFSSDYPTTIESFNLNLTLSGGNSQYALTWEVLPPWRGVDVYRSTDLMDWGTAIDSANTLNAYTDMVPPQPRAFYLLAPAGVALP